MLMIGELSITGNCVNQMLQNRANCSIKLQKWESDYETEGRDLEQTIHTYTKGEIQRETGSGQTDGMMDTINVQ